jgi:hypothetical protein
MKRSLRRTEIKVLRKSIKRIKIRNINIRRDLEVERRERKLVLDNTLLLLIH